MGDGSDTCRGFIQANYSVQILDDMEHHKSGKIKGAKYMTEKDSIGCKMTYNDIKQLLGDDESSSFEFDSIPENIGESSQTDRLDALSKKIQTMHEQLGVKYKEIKAGNAEEQLAILELQLSVLEDKSKFFVIYFSLISDGSAV